MLFILGYGGGFNERENVEYIEREESDGEYDEVRYSVYGDYKSETCLKIVLKCRGKLLCNF